MTASPNTTYTNDILGNRTGTTVSSSSGSGATFRQTGSMTWDCLNRMISATAPGALAHTNYEYRADGMRVQKSYYSGAAGSGTLGGPATTSGLATSSSISATAAAGAPVATTSAPTQTDGVGDVLTIYRYDGQMPMETYAAHDDGSSILTDHGLGARGIDYVQIQSLSTSGQLTTTVDYPIYDAHGNEVATLSKGGNNSYALNNQRSYGAWGEIRQGSTTGGPRGRYCGDLGHVQDDETNLVYMRARYYDSSSGRFISEDSNYQGTHLFNYCSNDPINYIDESGNFRSGENTGYFRMFYGSGIALMSLAVIFGALKLSALCFWAVEVSAMAFVSALGATDCDTSLTVKIDAVEFFMFGIGLGLMKAVTEGLDKSTIASGIARIALIATAAYSVMLAAGIFWCYEGP